MKFVVYRDKHYKFLSCLSGSELKDWCSKQIGFFLSYLSGSEQNITMTF